MFTILFNFLLLLIPLLMIGVLFRLTHHINEQILKRIDRWRMKRIVPGVERRQFVFSDSFARDITAWGIGMSRVISLFLLLIVYIWLTLRIFPETRAIIDQLYSMATYEEVRDKIRGYIPNFIFILIFIFITYFILKFIRLIFTEIDKGEIKLPGFPKEWSNSTYNLLRILVIALTLTVIYPYLPGAETPAFKSMLVFGGLVSGLGSAAATANVVAGTVLTYTRALKEGDLVKINQTVGRVINLSLFVTRLRTRHNVLVSVPNAKVLSGEITNYSTYAEERGLVLYINVGIGYDVPWRNVEALLIDAARQTNRILIDPAPFVLQRKFDQFSINYELNVLVREAKFIPQILSELHANVQDAFTEAGIEILSPTHTVEYQTPLIKE